MNNDSHADAPACEQARSRSDAWPAPASLSTAHGKRIKDSPAFQAFQVRRIAKAREQHARYLALFGGDRELYSVQVANLLSVHVHIAAGVLRAMERAGLLVSEHRASPTSGNGRRYYRRAA